MNDVLTGIQTAMQKLPMWGQAAVYIGLALLGVFLKQKYGRQPATPQTPTTPSAATVPAPLAAIGGMAHDALVALGLIPRTGATINDVSHDALMKLDAGVQAIKDAKAEAHAAALADLQPADPAPAVTTSPAATAPPAAK